MQGKFTFSYCFYLIKNINYRNTSLRMMIDHSASAYLSMYYIAWNTNSLFFFFPLIGKLHYIYYFFVSDGRYTLFGKVAILHGRETGIRFPKRKQFHVQF